MNVNGFSRKLFSNLFPPESGGEIALRSLYHTVMATKIAATWQIRNSTRSYRKWIQKQDASFASNNPGTKTDLKVSFILQIPDTQLEPGLDTIRSIQGMQQSDWELIVFSTIPEMLLPDKIAGEKRITIIHTPGSFEFLELYKMVSGQYILHCQPGDIFHKSLLDLFYQYHASFPQADVFSYDCEYPDKNTLQVLPFFKPSALSPELLLSVNYLSRAFIRTSTALHHIGKGDKSLDLQNRELDLILRLVENTAAFQHIPQVLVRQAGLSEPINQQTEVIISSHLKRTGRIDPLFDREENTTRISWKGTTPSVSIIIPSKNNHQLLSNLVDSILSVTDYPNYSITIVDNASNNPELLEYYRRLEKQQNIRVVQYDSPFNYSEAINLGVEKTDSELVLLLNNDMKVIDPWWLSELAQWAQRPEIGVVGGKLLRANHTIQHTGIILGMNGFMGHLYLNAPEHYCGLLGSADWYRNLYAVTGACQMVRRELFNRVGGYDGNYRLVFGDVDFCLRVHDLGYRNMVTPFARLYHYEGKSRGYKSPVDDILRGYDQMAERLKAEDPYFSPNLTYTPIPTCQQGQRTIDDRMKNIEIRRALLEKTKLEQI